MIRIIFKINNKDKPTDKPNNFCFHDLGNTMMNDENSAIGSIASHPRLTFTANWEDEITSPKTVVFSPNIFNRIPAKFAYVNRI